MQSDFTAYMLAQTQALEVAKWIEGERIGCDPGIQFCLSWIKKNGQKFREEYENKKRC